MISFKDIWSITILTYYYIVWIVISLTTDAHQLLFLASREAHITIHRYIHQANVFGVAYWTMYTCMHVIFRIHSLNKCAWSCTFMHIHTMNMYIHLPTKNWGIQNIMAPSICSSGHSLYECSWRCTFMYFCLLNVYGSATPTHSSDECVYSFPETQTSTDVLLHV